MQRFCEKKTPVSESDLSKSISNKTPVRVGLELKESAFSVLQNWRTWSSWSWILAAIEYLCFRTRWERWRAWWIFDCPTIRWPRLLPRWALAHVFFPVFHILKRPVFPFRDYSLSYARSHALSSSVVYPLFNTVFLRIAQPVIAFCPRALFARLSFLEPTTTHICLGTIENRSDLRE